MSDPYTEFAAKYGYQASERFKRILKVLMTEQQAAVANLLPAAVEDIAHKLNRKPAAVEADLQDLFQKGVIFESSKGYKSARDIFQLHDATGSDMRSDELWGRDLLDAWWDFSEKELFPDIAKLADAFPRPASRVIPARASIDESARLLPGEDINDIIDKSSRVAVVKCPCRRMAQKCERPLDVCLQMNRGADYAIKRGSGREISREEAKEILQLSAESGLVHSVGNSPEVGHYICNCCADCCIFMYPWLTYGGLDKGIAKSRFEARIDVESCSGCQDCVEQCPFGAIDMAKVAGQKKMKAHVDPQKCYGCGVCAVNCITDSIKLYEVRRPEHITA